MCGYVRVYLCACTLLHTAIQGSSLHLMAPVPQAFRALLWIFFKYQAHRDQQCAQLMHMGDCWSQAWAWCVPLLITFLWSALSVWLHLTAKDTEKCNLTMRPGGKKKIYGIWWILSNLCHRRGYWSVPGFSFLMLFKKEKRNKTRRNKTKQTNRQRSESASVVDN